MRTSQSFLAWTLVAALGAACAPSAASLFEPVRAGSQARLGVSPEWSPEAARAQLPAQRIAELVAEPITAERAAAAAVLGSPGLQIAYEELAAAGANLAAARTPPNPAAEADMTFHVDGDSDSELEISALQSITGLLALAGQTRSADAQVEAARRDAIAATVEVAIQARMAFYVAAAAEQRRDLRRVIAETATASATLARSLNKAGNLREIDLTREEVFEEEAEIAVEEAEAAAQAARARLGAALGIQDPSLRARMKLTVPLPDVPETLDAKAGVDALEAEAVKASLAIEALRFRLEGARQDIGVARLESFLPDLAFGVALRDESGWAVGPAVGIALPLFDWGQGERAAAWAEYRRLGHARDTAVLAVRAEARATAHELEAAHARVRRMRERILPRHERLVDQSVLQYNAMNMSPFELLAMKRAHVEAEERYIDALLGYWLARSRADALAAGAQPANHTVGPGEHE